MDRGTRRLFLAALGVVVVLGVLATVALSAPDAGPPSDAPTVVGVIVGVDSEGLGDVRSFDLRAEDGTLRTFGLAELRNGTAFPPGHLVEHSLTAVPVRVWYRTVDGVDQALWLEDEPAAS